MGVWHTHTHTHTRLTALFLGLPRWASSRKVKPMWILLKQETVASAGPYASLHLAPDRQSHQHPTTLVFYRPDTLPAAQPTASKQWRGIEGTCPPPKSAPYHEGRGPPVNTWFLGPTRIYNANGTSIGVGSDIFATLTNVSNKQTMVHE